MKKILTGILGIVLVASVVSASAYALFSSQAKVSGVTIASGNATLKIGAGGGGVTTSDLGLYGIPFPKLYPGVSGELPQINLYNESTADFNLKVKGQITSLGNTSGNVNGLLDNVQVRVRNIGSGAVTPWLTLRQWRDEARDLPGTIPPGVYGLNKGEFVIELRVPASVGNEIANTTLQNMVITLTGTQVNP